jgi:putative ABC transport system permease protein
MRLLKSLGLRLRALVARGAVDQDLDDEIRFHLDQETERNLRAGFPLDEARRRARVAFGNLQTAREAHRDAFGVRWAHDVAADARFALRTLRRTPVLATAAIVTIALGIGANTAIFSAVNGVILRPLPFPHAGQLVMLWESNPEYHWYQQDAAPANVLDWKEQVAAFSDVAMYDDGTGSVTYLGRGGPVLVKTASATGNLFSVLGVRAAIGRTLRDDETWSPKGANDRVLTVSNRFWRNQLGADSGAVGGTILVNGRAFTVVGVLPADFDFISPDIDLWAPEGWDPANRSQVSFRRAHWVRAVARLKPGVTVAEADAQLQAVVRRLQTEYPVTNRVMGGGMTPLHDFFIRDTRRPLTMLLAAVALLLLIACANVGNLLLVRALARGREVAMRLALGAGRGRLVRQALTESLVLSLLGGIVGLAVGWFGTRVLVVMQPSGLLPAGQVRMDWSVLGYVAGITAVSGILFGIAPAVWNGHRMPGDALKEGSGGGGTSRRVRRWGNALVVGEVALALLLTVGAGLLVRSYWKLTRVDAGFEPAGVLAVNLGLPSLKYDSAQKISAFYDELQRRLRGLPGVTATGLTEEVPLTSWGWTSQFKAQTWPSDRYGSEVAHRATSAGYFATLHVPILRGRNFGPEDGPRSPPVVLINQSLAEQYFHGENPIGQRVTFSKSPDSTSTWYTIVGVVGDERQTSLGAETKIQFTSDFAQDPSNGMYVVVHTSLDPSALGPSVRRVVHDLDPTLAIASMRTMDAVRDASLARQRFFMTMLLIFAVVGLVLALVGVYGVMAQLARARRREVGIRMALGASYADVRWLIVRHGLGLVTGGLAVGVVAAVFATRWMRVFLYGVSPGDPPTFVAVPVVLLAAGAMAAWVPAVRASRTDPVATLREE